MKTTTKELATKHGIELTYANGFIQTLVKINKAKAVGKVETPTGTRGKRAVIYEIDDSIFS